MSDSNPYPTDLPASDTPVQEALGQSEAFLTFQEQDIDGMVRLEGVRVEVLDPLVDGDDGCDRFLLQPAATRDLGLILDDGVVHVVAVVAAQVDKY